MRLTADGDRRDEAVAWAAADGVRGWVRFDPDGVTRVHAEGSAEAVRALVARRPWSTVESVRREGHEQFAVRGVAAGAFVVQEHRATAHHYDLRLELGGVMRSWALPKGPSLDPAVRRLAVQVDDHSLAHNAYESEDVIVWDAGSYERGGRVPWPAALQRGHAVFVLHGAKLAGGFALQRTRAGDAPQWLLIKRRDEHARPGSEIVAERPESVRSGRRLGGG